MNDLLKRLAAFTLVAGSAVFVASCGAEKNSAEKNSVENNNTAAASETVVATTIETKAANTAAADVAVTEADVKAHYIRMAAAVYGDSYQAAIALQKNIDAFLQAPSSEGQDAMKVAYKALRIPYQQSEIMRWDSDITLMQKLDEDGGPMSVDAWEGQVNAWPLDESFIDSIIASDVAITRELLLEQNGASGNEANVTAGIHAIEYLIWGADNHGTAAGSGERSYTDYLSGDGCTGANCERRATYLKVASDLLVDDLKTMSGEWTLEAANRKGTLANNVRESDEFLNYVLAAMGEMAVGELAGARINSALTTSDPEEEHDCFSDLSHLANYYNFIAIKNAFYGTYGDLSGPSLASLIKQTHQLSFEKMAKALESIEVDMQAMLDAGERSDNPVKFDQIIGQRADAAERQHAESAVNKLIGLAKNIEEMGQAFAIADIHIDGDGD